MKMQFSQDIRSNLHIRPVRDQGRRRSAGLRAREGLAADKGEGSCGGPEFDTVSGGRAGPYPRGLHSICGDRASLGAGRRESRSVLLRHRSRLHCRQAQRQKEFVFVVFCCCVVLDVFFCFAFSFCLSFFSVSSLSFSSSSLVFLCFSFVSLSRFVVRCCCFVLFSFVFSSCFCCCCVFLLFYCSVVYAYLKVVFCF